jgi:hypothetical protein
MRLLFVACVLIAAPAQAQLQPGPFATEIPGTVKPALDHLGGESFFRELSSRGRELVLEPGQHMNIELHERLRSSKIFCEAT